VNASVVPSVTQTASALSICAGSAVTFTATPTNGGTTPSYQWQVNGVNAGTNSPSFTTSTLNNGDIVGVMLSSNANCALPASVNSNTIAISVNASVVPSVTQTASALSICAGSAVTFTATPTNGGTTPTYQWQVNGVNAGTNSPTFSSSTLVNGDVVRVILTSNATCTSPTTATSNSITMSVTTAVVPSVINAASSTTICAGTSVTFTATPTNGGTTPAYQWQVNGVNAGTNSPTFSSSTLVNGDVVRIILTSNAACASPTTATSNDITMAVTAAVAPSVINAASSTSICEGTSVTFTATPTNGGTTPAYQWQVNGVNTGTNSPTFSSSTLSNNDVVRVILTSNANCASPTTTTSNAITMTVTAAMVPSVINVASSTSICAGTSVTFTATPTNGGTTPAYQWQVNGVNAGTNSPTFITSTLNNGDIIQVLMTPGILCANPSTAISNSIPVTVTSLLVPSINIAASVSVVCPGIPVSFNAAINNGGANPVYQWKLNGSNVGSNINSYIHNTPVDGDIINCQLTSNAVCVTNNPALSNNLSIDIDPVKCINGFYIPSAFTPGKNQINDIFRAIVPSAINDFEMKIWNRWGQQVFQSKDPASGWDGTFKTISQPSGVFVYHVSFIHNNVKIKKAGTVVLIR
jgi:gliding motility-associated-like protein